MRRNYPVINTLKASLFALHDLVLLDKYSSLLCIASKKTEEASSRKAYDWQHAFNLKSEELEQVVLDAKADLAEACKIREQVLIVIHPAGTSVNEGTPRTIAGASGRRDPYASAYPWRGKYDAARAGTDREHSADGLCEGDGPNCAAG